MKGAIVRQVREGHVRKPRTDKLIGLAIWLLLGVMWALPSSTLAAGFDDVEWVEKEGVIREIDLASRTAIISGYNYYFGSAGGYQVPSMSTLTYQSASLELLSVGMKVQFHVATRERPYRILRLRQLPDDSWLDNDELPDAIR